MWGVRTVPRHRHHFLAHSLPLPPVGDAHTIASSLTQLNRRILSQIRARIVRIAIDASAIAWYDTNKECEI